MVLHALGVQILELNMNEIVNRRFREDDEYNIQDLRSITKMVWS